MRAASHQFRAELLIEPHHKSGQRAELTMCGAGWPECERLRASWRPSPSSMAIIGVSLTPSATRCLHSWWRRSGLTSQYAVPASERRCTPLALAWPTRRRLPTPSPSRQFPSTGEAARERHASSPPLAHRRDFLAKQSTFQGDRRSRCVSGSLLRERGAARRAPRARHARRAPPCASREARDTALLDSSVLVERDHDHSTFKQVAEQVAT